MILDALSEFWLIGMPMVIVYAFVSHRSRVVLKDWFKTMFFSDPYGRAQCIHDPLPVAGTVVIMYVGAILFFGTLLSLNRLGGFSGAIHAHVHGLLAMIVLVVSVVSIKLSGVWRFYA